MPEDWIQRSMSSTNRMKRRRPVKKTPAVRHPKMGYPEVRDREVRRRRMKPIPARREPDPKTARLRFESAAAAIRIGACREERAGAGGAGRNRIAATVRRTEARKEPAISGQCRDPYPRCHRARL